VTPKGYLVSGEVVQEGEIYEVQVQGRVDIGEGEKDLPIDLSKRRNSFSIEIPRAPISLTLDPDHHIFRRLYPEETIPCFNAFLEDSEDYSPPPSLSRFKGEGREAPPSRGRGAGSRGFSKGFSSSLTKGRETLKH
jgi:hypothetical protein